MLTHFHVPAKTALYAQVKEYYEECHKIHRATAKYVAQFNEHGTYIPYSSSAGSIYGIGFKPDQEIPKGWIRKTKKEGFVFYRPNGRSKAGKKLNKEFEELPQKSIFHLTDIFDYGSCPKSLYPAHYFDPRRNLLVVSLQVDNLPHWKSKPAEAKELTATEYEALKQSPLPVTDAKEKEVQS